MSTSTIIIILLIGLSAGMLGSMVGIGGGIVVVPALVLLLAMPQVRAQGTSLAMLLPPIGVLGAWQYYKQGQVDLKVAAILCLGFLIGGFLGAKIVLGMDKALLKKFFASFLIVLGIYFLFLEKYTKASSAPKSEIRLPKSEI